MDDLFNSTTDGDINATTSMLNDYQNNVKNVLKTWVQPGILLLGIITNTLTVAVLSRTRIGCVTTKIILTFLALSDLLVMLLVLFLEYIPMYQTTWFRAYYENTCGFATTILNTSLTSATWYLTLVTTERFVAVSFPLKARYLCTKKKTIIVCCCVPLICFCIYAYFLTNMEPIKWEGYIYMCVPKKRQNKDLFRLMNQLWITFYFLIPGVLIVSLNAAIIWNLRKASKMGVSQTDHVPDLTEPNKRKLRIHRRATNMVVIASITFVVLMMPRGIFISITLDVNWSYRNAHEVLFDAVATNLQLLNHAINFFIYILANARFRKEFQKITCCCGCWEHLVAVKRGSRFKAVELQTAFISKTESTEVTHTASSTPL